MKKLIRSCCSALPALLAATALILSAHAAINCTFVEFVVPPETHSHKQAGLWNYQWWDRDAERYTCHAYPPDNNSIPVDAKWKAARGFSCMTLIFGFLAVVNAMLPLCWKRCKRSSTKLLRYCGNRNNNTTAVHEIGGAFYLISALCSSLSLLFVRSNACQHNTIFNMMRDHECKLSTGAKCTYAAMILWFIAACLELFLVKHATAEAEGAQPQIQHTGVIGDTESNDATEPLIQDIIFECEQTTYSRDGEE